MWTAIAGLAQLALAAFGHLLWPYLHNVLIALGYGLVLPLIAVLHVRHRLVRQSGAILGTIAGTSAVIVGLGAAATLDLRPAGLFVLGMWWWTIGKMWVETRVLSASAGFATAVLGALAIAATVVDVIDVFVPGIELDAWQAGRIALGVWLVAIAVMLARERGTEA